MTSMYSKFMVHLLYARPTKLLAKFALGRDSWNIRANNSLPLGLHKIF